MAGVNSILPKEPRNDILRMQNIIVAVFNGTKKAANLGMKVSREKQCFNTQFAHMSSVFCPDRQVLLMLLSWGNNCPSTASFQSPIQVNSSSIEQNVSIQKKKFECRFLSWKWLWFPTLQQQAHGIIPGGNFINCSINFSIWSKLQLPSRNYFKVFITWTSILFGQL